MNVGHYIYMTCVIYVVSATSTVEVTTKLGKIKGLNITYGNRNVIQFRQIPYAQPPIYGLRFHKPKKILSWITVLDGTQFGPVCPQKLSNRYKNILVNKNISENCLHLYIYIPNNIDQLHPKPVMVYIHGGGYYSKSGTLYDGSDLALHGDVIVVLINYRLGIFGFMSTEDDNAKGNYGLWDQIMALNWIKDHIPSFGGDQTKITVFGHSAGGYSIGLLSLSPLTEGLYQRAISMSGFGTSERAITHGAKNTTVKLAKLLSCTDGNLDSGSVDTSNIVHCMKTKFMSAILEATGKIQTEHTKSLSFIMSPGPVVDNEIILDVPKTLLTDLPSASFKRFISIDYMAGTNDADGGLLRSRISGDARLSNYTVNGITTHAFCSIVIPRLSDDYFKANKNVSKVVCNKYKSSTNNFDQGQQSVLMYGDMMYTSEAVRTLRFHSKYSNRTSYQFIFTHQPSFTILKTLPKWMKGAYHGFEIPFIFQGPAYNYSKEELSLNDAMMTYLTNFARYGNPNGINSNGPTSDHLPVWKEFDIKNENYINFNINVTVGEHLFQDRMNLWLNTVPGILAGKQNMITTSPSGHASNSTLPVPLCLLYNVLIVLCSLLLIHK